MTTEKKKPTKKLTVKNLEGLKGGIKVDIEVTVETEDTVGNVKKTMANQKGGNSAMASASLSTARRGAISG